MTASALPGPSLLAAEAEVTANPVHVHLAQSCYLGTFKKQSLLSWAFHYLFTRLVDCEMEAGKILCNIDMIDPDLCDLSAVCNVTIDSFNEMMEGLKNVFQPGCCSHCQ